MSDTPRTDGLREAAEKALGWMESAWYKINGEWDPLERSPDDEAEITNLRDALAEPARAEAELARAMKVVEAVRSDIDLGLPTTRDVRIAFDNWENGR